MTTATLSPALRLPSLQRLFTASDILVSVARAAVRWHDEDEDLDALESALIWSRQRQTAR